MANQTRINQIQNFITFWEKAINAAEQKLEYLVKAKELGITLNDEKNGDKNIIPKRIEEEIRAIDNLNKNKELAENLLFRAKNGEDV